MAPIFEEVEEYSVSDRSKLVTTGTSPLWTSASTINHIDKYRFTTCNTGEMPASLSNTLKSNGVKDATSGKKTHTQETRRET